MRVPNTEHVVARRIRILLDLGTNAALLLLLLGLKCPSFAHALTFRDLTLGSVIPGDTRESWGSVLPIQSQGKHPQAIYSFTVPANGGIEADIRFTTCVPFGESAIQYDLASSVIFILDNFDSLPSDSTSPIIPIATSVPDCGGEFASLDFRAPVGNTFILVVSSSSGRGNVFRLESSINPSPPTPTPLPWGLDRIDQRSLPLDKKYSVTGLSGKKVYVYVLDSGVRVTHSEFLKVNGEHNAIHGADMVERLDYATDCTGHGTHVAAKIAGNSYGVAKDSVVISVRVTGCNGAGITSRLLEGLNFVLEDSEENKRKPAVVTISLTSPKSDAINKAVSELSAKGIPVVTAAGNAEEDSCNFSPASEKSSITVAASNRDDSRPHFSNSGACVDLFAPGEDIVSAWHTGDHASSVQSGTSFACPHVAGAVAILLSVNPTLPSEALANMIYSAATVETVTNYSVASSESRTEDDANVVAVNNRLLYVRPIPSLSLERPPKDYMYIYTVLSILKGIEECSQDWLDFGTRQKGTEAKLSTMAGLKSEELAIWICCPGSEADKERCGSSSFSGTRVFAQYRTSERLASSTFNTLDENLRNTQKLDSLRSTLGSEEVSVAIEPWVVDSDGNVFWTGPDLRADKRDWLSTGVLIAIIMCSCALLVAIVVGVLIWIRDDRERRETAKCQEAVQQHEEQKATQDAIQPMDKIFDPGSPREYNGFIRENSALHGDALISITSNGSLRTPRPSIGQASSFKSSRSVRSTRSTLNSFADALKFPFGSRNSEIEPDDLQRQRTHDELFRKRTTELRRNRQAGGGRAPRTTGAGMQQAGFGSEPGTDALAPTPRDAKGMPKGVSFFDRAISFRFGTKAPSSSSAQQNTKEDRETAKQTIEGSRPFRPAQALAPSALQAMGESCDEPPFDNQSD